MITEELIACAEYLLNRPASDRTQADVNRAASTYYYALFNELAWTCATLFIGEKPADRGKRAWQQVYRALEHGTAKQKCRGLYISRFPEGIKNFANHFALMQERRHKCDYDPLQNGTHTEILFDVANANTLINGFRNAPELDRRAFCAYVLLKNREDPERERAMQQELQRQQNERKRETQAAERAVREAQRVRDGSH